MILNSIFMPQDLREQFKEINKSLAEVLIKQQTARQSPDPKLYESSYETMGRVSGMFENIESAVQKRLRYEEA